MNGNDLRGWLRALAQPTTYLGVAMLAVVIAGLSFLLLYSHSVEEDEAKQAGENVVRLFTQSVSRVLTSADNTLLLMRKIYESHPDDTGFVLWPNGTGFENDMQFQYSLVGADGFIKASSYGPRAIGLDLSDLQHFQAQSVAMEDQLYLSKPILVRATGKWSLVLSRRLTKPDGTFDGIITTSFDLAEIQNLLRRVQLGVDSAVTLFDFDGVIYARILQNGFDGKFVGQSFPQAGIFQHIAQTPAGTYWNHPQTVDGIRRLLSYRVVEGFPLIAAVGISQAVVFQQWDRVFYIYLAVGGLLSIAILIAIALGALREKRLMAAKGDLERVNFWFDSALDSMSQGLTMFDASDRLLLINNRYREMYGLDPEQIRPGCTVRDVVMQRAEGKLPSEVEGYLAETLRELKADRGVDRTIERKDGRFYAISLRPVKGGGWVSTHQDVTEQTLAEREVQRLAHHDVLTELTSRGLFQSHVARAVVRLKRRGRRFNILMLDLDRFKAVNDSLGHLAGDRLLKQVAARLKACAKRNDVVARLGGDEFAVLQSVQDHPRAEAIELANRLLNVIGEPYDLDGHRVIIETSIGIALAPEHGGEAEQLLKSVDLALYQAKSEGRNAWRMFEQQMADQARARYELEIDLRGALKRQEFELHYQPLLIAATRRICGFEALVRWRDPVRGMVPVHDFIPIAEGTGLIVPLGEWILRRACEDAMAWPDDVKIAVNLSPIQFAKGELIDTVTRVLSETGLPAKRLELEITETVLLQADERNTSKLHQLKALGVSIVLDDFGTGYSSLSYLRMFPFDKIKIDRSFVAEIATRADCAAIVTAVTGLARTLDIVTTAEGVETIEQFERLRIAGCEQVQGYLFGRPVPAAELRLERDSRSPDVRVA